MRLTPTNNEETLLERYQREHRVYEEFRMNKHTTGNLSVVDNSWEVSSIYAESGRCVAVCHINQDATEDTQAEYEIMKEANARRLVAAWNACDGISTETLELVSRFTEAGIKTVQSVEAERDSLRAVNAELLEALEKSLAALEKANKEEFGPISDTIWFSEYETLFDFMGAAIASARK